MYNADAVTLEKLKDFMQTPANNNEPSPKIYIVRNRTAISSQRYWERQQISSVAGSRASIAVRRPENNITGDQIFLAQIENGNATIQWANTQISFNDLAWHVLTTISGITDISLVFDGIMETDIDKVEAYTMGDLPYVFYIKNGTLSFQDLSIRTEATIADNAAKISTVRGLYAETAGVDDGILVFWIDTSGGLHEAAVIDGAVSYSTTISNLPDGVTGWSDVWAGRTFDYRICLQLKGNDGYVYTLMSKSRPSGFAILEHLRTIGAKVNGKIGLIPPVPLYSENVEVTP